jgi:ketosteroid isomerase-like protein
MTRAAIKHNEEQLRLAMLASDVPVLDRLIHDALLFSTPTGAIARKEEDLENHRTGRQKLTKLVQRDLVVELVSDDLGIVTVVAELEGTFDGAPFGGTVRYIRTWHRPHEGEWQIVAGAVTAVT